ncbi:sulfotransferase family 2 domain-containing protein [Ectopseudomonas oleovorans]|uniref:sulfotransferase family 2 domain-containing protein n=1 Tax=Ectopseudomonas oleovorans TaxID=301 RepID=UPI00244D0A6E|nr:sulfotransferase family 2 domain-containing protein [Pseudomonas oleovorans]MDG9980345.1 sulfotransferase family protein [Pseudomonas oleovorans]
MKVLFVHIAKAAGSSVNKIFLDAFGYEACAVHLESNQEWRVASGIEVLAKEKNYLSGHIIYREFMDKLNLGEYFVFTFLRNPIAHVVSHLAWIKKLAEPNEIERFKQHPEYIQSLAMKIDKVNFDDALDVLRFVEDLSAQERNLLDNPQVRYLRQSNIGGLVGAADVDSSLKTLAEIDDFGLVECIDVDLARIVRATGINITSVPKENVLSSKYGLSELNDVLINSLYELIRHDMSLYERASALREELIASERLKDFSLPDQVVVNIDAVNESLLHGWARYERSKVPVTLDIFVNAVFLDKITAPGYRVDLYEKFSKNCAFVYKFDGDFKPSKGDVFTVRVANTEIKTVKIFSS